MKTLKEPLQNHSFKWLKHCETVIFYLLLLVFCLFPLPFGAVQEWAFLGLASLCFALSAIFLIMEAIKRLQQNNASKSIWIDPATLLILFVAIWFFVQGGLKLPLDVLAVFASKTADLYRSTFTALSIKDPNNLAPISLDPGHSIDRGLLSLACFCIIFLMGQLLTTRQRLIAFCYVIVLSGVFQAAFGMFMTLSGKEYLFFTPKTSSLGVATGTFVNRNSLAGYLEMTLAMGVGLLLSVGKTSPANWRNWRGGLRWFINVLLSPVALVRIMLIIMVLGLIMTHSRMGNAAFFNAFLLIGSFALGTSKHFRRPGFYAVLVSVILVDIFLLGSLFGLHKVVERIENTQIDGEVRLDVDDALLIMLPDFWLTGSGAGSFASIFSHYQLQYIPAFFDLAHNDYLQILLEAGLIGTVPLSIYLMIGIIRAWKLLQNQAASSLCRGIGFTTLMAVASLLMHAAVDFNLQIPANLMLFIAILALPAITGRVYKAT